MGQFGEEEQREREGGREGGRVQKLVVVVVMLKSREAHKSTQSF